MPVATPSRPRAAARPKPKGRPDPILSEAQALALKRADDAVSKARKELEAREEERSTLRTAYKDLIPMASDDDERAKGIREITILGGKIRVTPKISGKTFSLSKYVAAGGKISAKMAEFMGGQKPYDCWTVDIAD